VFGRGKGTRRHTLVNMQHIRFIPHLSDPPDSMLEVYGHAAFASSLKELPERRSEVSDSAVPS
jgi:hypothetical protein